MACSGTRSPHHGEAKVRRDGSCGAIKAIAWLLGQLGLGASTHLNQWCCCVISLKMFQGRCIQQGGQCNKYHGHRHVGTTAVAICRTPREGEFGGVILCVNVQCHNMLTKAVDGSTEVVVLLKSQGW